jgi:hypothetical protein
MPVKVFISYRINRDRTRDEYRSWSRDVDQPMASRQPGVISYEIYEIQGSGTGESWTDVIEVIEAESWEAWQKVNDYPEMKEAVEQFWTMAERDSVKVVYGEQIEP